MNEQLTPKYKIAHDYSPVRSALRRLILACLPACLLAALTPGLAGGISLANAKYGFELAFNPGCENASPLGDGRGSRLSSLDNEILGVDVDVDEGDGLR